jgi:hypothetical protein
MTADIQISKNKNAVASIEHVIVVASHIQSGANFGNRNKSKVITSNAAFLSVPKFYDTFNKNHTISTRTKSVDTSIRSKIVSTQTPLKDEEIVRILSLNNSFSNERKRVANNNLTITNELNAKFEELRSLIFRLPFSNCAIEILQDQSLKLSLSFPNDKLLMLTKSSKLTSNNEVLYSFFINRKLISSDITELHVFVKGFKEYIS